MKKNAVEDLRALIGAMNPAKAVEGTIRKMYAIVDAFYFSEREMF